MRLNVADSECTIFVAERKATRVTAELSEFFNSQLLRFGREQSVTFQLPMHYIPRFAFWESGSFIFAQNFRFFNLFCQVAIMGRQFCRSRWLHSTIDSLNAQFVHYVDV